MMLSQKIRIFIFNWSTVVPFLVKIFLGLSTVDRPISKPERLLRGPTPSSECSKRWTRAWRCWSTSFRDSSAEPRSSITVRLNMRHHVGYISSSVDRPWAWPWSCGQRPRLLIRRSEIESCWLQNLLEKTKKESGVGPSSKKLITSIEEHNSRCG